MAEYHVKNGSHVDKAFKVRGGHQVVPAGKEADVVDAKEITEAQIDAFEREGVKVKAKGGKTKAPEAGLKAIHSGGGKFNVVDGDTVLLSGLSKADADAFNAMSDAEKITFIEAEKAKF
ncbi:MAG: hypothetical protein J0H34_22425 [Rhizobiales bacterium]|nr:hypothetical protein [Hyphomicrobiales bacterium]